MQAAIKASEESKALEDGTKVGDLSEEEIFELVLKISLDSAHVVQPTTAQIEKSR